MTTTGFRAYRHRARFYSQYIRWDAYPEGLGRELFDSVPIDPEKYAEWLAERRNFFDEILAQTVDQNGDPLWHPDYRILHSAQRARSPFSSVDYSYTIDLDHEVFYFDAFPVFPLRCLPPVEAFEECLQADHFGHCIPGSTLPEQHRCSPCLSRPPKQDNIDVYETYKEPSGFKALQETLDNYSSLSRPNAVRVRLYELIAYGFVGDYELHSAMCCTGIHSDDEEDAGDRQFVEEAALKLLLVAFLPMHHGDYYGTKKGVNIDAEYQKRSHQEGFWIFYNLCAKAVIGYLDSEDALRGSVGELVRHIHGTSKQGVIYGVVCSLFHIVVVRVDMSNGGHFEHTPALGFLPPRIVDRPWVQGVEVLMKLAFHLQASVLSPAVDLRGMTPPDATAHTPTHVDKLPLELILEIFEYVRQEPSTHSDTLVAFGSLNEHTRAAFSARGFAARISSYWLDGLAAENRVPARWKYTSDVFEQDPSCCSPYSWDSGIYLVHGKKDYTLRPYSEICIFRVGSVGSLTLLMKDSSISKFWREWDSQEVDS
ncbi:hypothetical protein CCMSSC00406_0009471 [Pleurotus cornucopiae]|uniref:Uncharacterized protein n=1 Tax=Pleurotus cornucopiae TaxID=5321 RepID=A0ACB7J1K2_PLECO|nr:hypothetical protein CCMSSC00406_0009471 [Pleurotus cornucopiae]